MLVILDRKGPLTTKTKRGCEEAGISKVWREKSDTSKINVSVKIVEALRGPPLNLQTHTDMPWIAHGFDDKRGEDTQTHNTVDSVVPYPLKDLKGINPQNPVAEAVVMRMANCMGKFQNGWWPN